MFINNCPFDVWAPDHRNHMNNTAFSLYAMENEGDLPTRRGKIERVIKELLASDNPGDFQVQCAIYDKVGIDSDTFADEEINYIETEVARRWNE